MVHILEDIRVGEGSIRLGATGKISALITHELNTTKIIPKESVSYEKRPQTVPVSVYCGVTKKRKQPRRKALSRRTSATGDNRRRPKNIEKKLHKNQGGNAHQVPMLSAEDMYTDGTPVRDTNTKRSLRIAEIVDLKCGISADNAWSGPITDQFRKLSFSRLPG